MIRRALIQRRYGDRPQLLHKVPTDLEEEAGKVQSPFITDGMTRSSAQLSWHFMKLLHDTERGTLVIVHRGLHDLIGPYLITPMIGEPVTGWWGRRQRYGMSNPSAGYYGGLMAVHGERIRRVVVVEVRSLADRRLMVVRESRVDRLVAIAAELNAALGYPTRATVEAHLDAIPVLSDQIPSARKAALIARRRRLALRAIAFHRRNRLRSTAHPAVALALAVVNAAIVGGYFLALASTSAPDNGVLQGALFGFMMLAFGVGGAVISYIIRALSTPAKQRAAAAAGLRALKRDARGRP